MSFVYTKNNIVTNTILYFSRRFATSSIAPPFQNNSTSSDARCCGRYVQGMSLPHGPHTLPQRKKERKDASHGCTTPAGEGADRRDTPAGEWPWERECEDVQEEVALGCKHCYTSGSGDLTRVLWMGLAPAASGVPGAAGAVGQEQRWGR